MFLLLIQVFIPLVLLLALARRTCRRVTRGVRAAAVFAYLLGVHLAGLWLDLPWWTPWTYWPLYLVSLLAGWRPAKAAPPSGWPGWLAPAGWSVAAVASAGLAATAMLSQVPPPGPLVHLSSALPPGRYLVANGGSNSLTNAHLKTLHPKTPRQAAHRGQSYGIDIVGLERFGRSSDGWQPRNPERYAIFGTPIIAPCAGRVMRQVDGRPDMPVPERDEHVMAGNHVLLQCEDVQVLLGHMRRGSVTVRMGQLVRAGQRLGEVGNSGNSDVPHLHIHAQRPGSAKTPIDGDPLPIRIDGRYPVRGDRL